MRDSKFTVSSMHGGMPQEERSQSAADFRAGGQLVLITTDTRGIDMPEVSHVINFEIPINRENYIDRIHRFGLPGGCKTVTVNLVRVQEVKILRDIGRHYGTQIVGPANAAA
ncbi:hypothetical protein M407DRAFT_247134 [Tulasnella calospora MUT 4182]|uniref:Helicase C-terminal domain-containing protein n=1 Tax=Tulasnella calospora MUT 4182 TaxID=1051891 RepID=A0A0C3Q0L1_9AGAM|nr:hypothetical protein M407DRAFT_247134 [Tulasnella calospora MUT 4182]